MTTQPLVMPLVQRSHALILFSIVYIWPLMERKKMPLPCIAVFRILVNCEPLSLHNFFRVQSVSSQAVWGHPACLNVLYIYSMVSIFPLHIALGKVVPSPWGGWFHRLRMGGFVTQLVSFPESPECPFRWVGGVGEEKGGLHGWWASLMAWGTGWFLCAWELH